VDRRVDEIMIHGRDGKERLSGAWMV